MAWITRDDVQTNCDKLQQDKIDAKMDSLITEAIEIVKSDISGLKNIYEIENYDPAPKTLRMLSIYKARQLGYKYYYGKIPEGSEIQYYQNEYQTLLNRIEQRLSKIDDTTDTVERRVEFV